MHAYILFLQLKGWLKVHLNVTNNYAHLFELAFFIIWYSLIENVPAINNFFLSLYIFFLCCILISCVVVGPSLLAVLGENMRLASLLLSLIFLLLPHLGQVRYYVSKQKLWKYDIHIFKRYIHMYINYICSKLHLWSNIS